MPYQINIFNMKTNGVANNANVDIGATVHNSHTADSKLFGVNMSLGDFSPSSSYVNNVVLDPDFTDQGQAGNPSFPITTQA